ncbi:MAG: hypothetical protein PUA90_05870 [bacterium]|nr:hypothetical protein [bacterium]
MRNKKIKVLKEGKKFISSLAVMLSISQLFGTTAYALDSDVSTEENTTTIESSDNITTNTNVKVSYSDSEVFDNEDDALEKKKKYEEKQENIKNEVESLGGTYDYSVEVVEEEGEITNIEFESDAKDLEEVEKEIEDKIDDLGEVEIIEIETEEKTHVEDLGSFDFDENYATLEEVEDAIDEKTEEIEQEGGTLIESSIDEEFVETKKTTTTVSLDGKTEEEISDIIKEYESMNNDKCRVVVIRKTVDVNTGEYTTELVTEICDSRDEAIEKMKEMEEQGYTVDYSNIIEERNTEKDVVTETTGTEAYDTLEEAEEAAKLLETDTKEVKVVATIRKENSGKEEVIIENKSFKTEQEAEEYIKELESQGYIVENYEINSVVENTGKVVEASKDDESKTLYVFDASKTNFVLIKQANGHYAVWTNEELSDEERNEFVKSYNEVNTGSTKFDGSTQNIELSQITFINGYDSFDLSYIGEQWGTYTFSKTDDSLNLDIPSKKVSHTVFGYCLERMKEFLLNASAILNNEEYYIDLETTQKGYDYVAKGEKEVEIIEETPILVVEKEEDIYKYVGHASYNKEVVDGYSVNIKYQDIMYRVSTKGNGEYTITIIDEKEPSKNKPNSDVPKTGDENDLEQYALMSSASLLGAAAAVKCLKLTKKKDE